MASLAASVTRARSHDLRLTGAQRDRNLLFGTPRYCGSSKLEDETRLRVPHSPVRIGVALEWSCAWCVAQTDMLVT